MSDNHVRDDPDRILATYQEAKNQIIPIMRGPQQGWQVRAIHYLDKEASLEWEVGRGVAQSTWSRALAGEPTWDRLVQIIDRVAGMFQDNVRLYGHPGNVPDGELRRWLASHASSAWWEEVLQTQDFMSTATFRSYVAGQPTRKENLLRERVQSYVQRLDAEIARYEALRQEWWFLRMKMSHHSSQAQLMECFQTRLLDWIERTRVTGATSLQELVQQNHAMGGLYEEARRIFNMAYNSRWKGFDPGHVDCGLLIWEHTGISLEFRQKEVEEFVKEALLTDFQFARRATPTRGLVYEEEKESVERWYLDNQWGEWWWRDCRWRYTYVWNPIEKVYEEKGRDLCAVKSDGGWKLWGPDDRHMLFSAEHWDFLWHRTGKMEFEPGEARRVIWE